MAAALAQENERSEQRERCTGAQVKRINENAGRKLWRRTRVSGPGLPLLRDARHRGGLPVAHVALDRLRGHRREELLLLRDGVLQLGNSLLCGREPLLVDRDLLFLLAYPAVVRVIARSTLRDSWLALRAFGRGLLLMLIAILPWALPIGIVVWLAIRSCRRWRAKRAAKRAATAATAKNPAIEGAPKSPPAP